MTGDELFSYDEMPTSFSVMDFWQSLDLLSDNTRDSLAAFLIAQALGDIQCVKYSISSAMRAGKVDEDYILSTEFKVPDLSGCEAAIFCLYSYSSSPDPLFIDDWMFFLADARYIPREGSISLYQLRQIHAKLLDYSDLKSALSVSSIRRCTV